MILDTKSISNRYQFSTCFHLFEIAKRLLGEKLIQSHRSFLVNLQKVDLVDLQDSVLPLGAKQAPLSKRNKENVLKQLDWI